MTSSEIIIRPFKSEDYDAATAILLQSFKTKFTALTSLNDEDLFGFLKLMNIDTSIPREGLFVAEEKGTVQGIVYLRWKDQTLPIDLPEVDLFKAILEFGLINVLRFLIGMTILEEELPSTDCYIEHIAVSADARGKGVGTQLMVFGEQFAKQQGFKRFTLNVTARNEKAVKLYKHLGFNITNTINSWLSRVILKEKTFFFMSKILKGPTVTPSKENQ